MELGISMSIEHIYIANGHEAHLEPNREEFTYVHRIYCNLVFDRRLRRYLYIEMLVVL